MMRGGTTHALVVTRATTVSSQLPLNNETCSYAFKQSVEGAFPHMRNPGCDFGRPCAVFETSHASSLFARTFLLHMGDRISQLCSLTDRRISYALTQAFTTHAPLCSSSVAYNFFFIRSCDRQHLASNVPRTSYFRLTVISEQLLFSLCKNSLVRQPCIYVIEASRTVFCFLATPTFLPTVTCDKVIKEKCAFSIFQLFSEVISIFS
ncbi:hypothetical protein Tcan_01819 [Toxocara canis]|uniref:Uncharacterized protein n=1 Tax=Toxocara canis TaxID=6265 RepID=A0A0B2UPE5_TOXCA|nr:hypothetical protein Tcan_01819 [Toxocara canis]